MKNIYITGHRGYIGSRLLQRGFKPLDCDVTDVFDTERALRKARPSLLIHLASKSSPDWCEDNDNLNEATNVNIRAVRDIFAILKTLRIPGVLLSSDYVWRGSLFEAHKEDSDYTPAVNRYGMMKQAAESFAERIIRTSYLFDEERLASDLLALERGETMYYPVFIRRSFMHVEDFCDDLQRYCDNFYQMPKVLHLSGSKVVSWYGLMREINKQFGFTGKVKPRFREEKGNAPRPYFGGLNTNLAHRLGFACRDYVQGVKRMKYG
jgi:dTDP-4-dehydrorhamnose reductase